MVKNNMDKSSADPKNLAVKNTSSSPSSQPSDGPFPINPDTLPPFEKDKGVSSSVALDDDDNHSKSEEDNIGKEKAPVPGNCCNFSTINCCKFWAIFNLGQLCLCWILVCVIHLTTFLGNPDPNHDETIFFKLYKCTQGGSVGAQNTRLAFQIILLLVYTAGSILFLLCNYPLKQVVSQRPLFLKIYTWTLVAFVLVFAIPFIFHLPIGECYYFISVTLWTVLFIELSIGVAVSYFSWRVIKLFRNYLRETSPPSPSNGKDEATTIKGLGTPPLTPKPSKNDFGTPPPTPKPSINSDEVIN